jgi:hypothetical protein
MTTSSACCMTVRDCAPFLPKVFENIDRLRTLFKEFFLIVAYDNCLDGSEHLLKQYQSRSYFPVYLLKSENTSPHRTVRIANARNRCLDKLDELDVPIHFMIDADDVNIMPWNLTLLRYYVSRQDWDVLSFNRKDYYDIWALMYPPFQHHCWGFRNRSRDVVAYIKKDITSKLENCDELFPCQSAFNGFAIYRTHVFKHARYNGEYIHLKQWITDEERKHTLDALSPIGSIEIDETFVQSCEHLYYHLSAPNARIYISKYFIY